MPTILIFGASGFTGGRLVEAALHAGWQVTAAVRSHTNDFEGVSWQQLDITDEAQTARLVIPTATLASGRAPRHQNGILSIEKARQVLSTPMFPLEETLTRSVNTDLS